MTGKPEIDMWGTARKMREVYGVFAAATAAKRARQAQGAGDEAAHERWRRIAEIVAGPAAQARETLAPDSIQLFLPTR